MTANLPALVDRSGNEIRKGRISDALRSAIVLIVHDALTVAEAAERTGFKSQSLAKALLKPHVRAYRADVKRAWLASKTSKAWLVVANLAESAGSEKVQLEAARTILQASGELSPDDGEGQRQAVALIQFIKNETHVHGGQPLTSRIAGVVQAVEHQDVDFEPLDRGSSLTPSDDA